ncbi:MAG TPA: hypothetical protein VFR32_01165 [Gaiellaceae bacterium]|nr:hypothetical protein [Gaiellaceae bacterium]
MNTRRRLSEAISEGESISTLARVSGSSEAIEAEGAGAEGIVTEGALAEVRSATNLPMLVLGSTPEEAAAAGANAWLLVTETDGDDLESRYALAGELGLECVVDVRDEDELEAVLAQIDPEIVLLSPREAETDEAVDHVLELLPDVPAGKLVAAELHSPTEDDVHALERAGVDAVVVALAAMPVARVE